MHSIETLVQGGRIGLINAVNRVEYNSICASFETIRMTQLRRILVSILNKGCGINEIPVKILKLSFEALVDKYLEVINNSRNIS